MKRIKRTFIVTGYFKEGSDIGAQGIEGTIERTFLYPGEVNLEVTEATSAGKRYLEHGAEMERMINNVLCGDYTHDQICDLIAAMADKS